MSDDNIIKFRKRPPPPPPKKKPKAPLRVPPWVIIVLGALALGGVSYVMDQGRVANPPRVAGP